MHKFVSNKKKQTWDENSHISISLGCNFEKTIVLFEISTLELFAPMENFVQNKKIKIWDQKWLIWLFLSKTLQKLLSYLTPAHSSFPNHKVFCKTKYFQV